MPGTHPHEPESKCSVGPNLCLRGAPRRRSAEVSGLRAITVSPLLATPPQLPPFQGLNSLFTWGAFVNQACPAPTSERLVCPGPGLVEISRRHTCSRDGGPSFGALREAGLAVKAGDSQVSRNIFC